MAHGEVVHLQQASEPISQDFPLAEGGRKRTPGYSLWEYPRRICCTPVKPVCICQARVVLFLSCQHQQLYRRLPGAHVVPAWVSALLLTVYQWQQCILLPHSFGHCLGLFHGLGVFPCIFLLFGWRSQVLTDWGLLHLVTWVSKVLQRGRLLTMLWDAA